MDDLPQNIQLYGVHIASFENCDAVSVLTVRYPFLPMMS